MASILRSLVVSGAVAAVSNAAATLYTAPANGYAIINLVFNNPGAQGANVTVGGSNVFIRASGTDSTHPPYTVYVGPSQAVVITSIDPAATIEISGVEFTNSA